MSITVSATNHRVTRQVGGHDYPEWVHLSDDPVHECEHPLFVNWCNVNARAVLALLRLASPPDPTPILETPSGGQSGPDDLYGEISVPEARRAVIYARATFTRRAPALCRVPEDVGNLHSAGIGEEYLARQLDRFAAFVEAVATKGATHITWG